MTGARVHAATRFPLRAVAQRLSASRPCAVGADQCRHGARRPAGGCCCASRTSTRRAAGRNTRRRSTRTSPGSGFEWEQPVWRQSEHTDDYRAALRRLDAHGARLSELREPRRDRHDGGRARRQGPLAARSRRRAALSRQRQDACRSAERAAAHGGGEPYALRLDMAAALARAGALTWQETGAGPGRRNRHHRRRSAHAWGDVILARKDAPASYHLAVTVDDAAQGVTDVVRGRDLFHATSVHRLLQALLGCPAPRYHHHRLILDADGKKLSKSTAATGLARIARGRRQRRPISAAASGSIDATLPCHGPAPGRGDAWRSASSQDKAQGKRKAKARGEAAARRARARPSRPRRAPSRPRSPASPTTCARRSPASWRWPSCWPRPASARASANGRTPSRAAPIIWPRSPR